MFIISAGAGLGNQMFEYAFYLKLQNVYGNSVIKMDTQYAFPKAHNGYEVERIFNLNSEKASLYEVEKYADTDYLEYFGKQHIFLSKIKRNLGIHKKSFIPQRDFTEYDERFLNLNEKKTYYFYGPFANSKYFEDIKDRILETFVFPEVDEKNLEMKELINKTNSVSIHLRRGDYLDQGVELLGLEYYKQAVEELKETIHSDGNNLTYFVFSDDIDASRKMFGDLRNTYYVEGNLGENSYRDMQLMSLCKHNIISNSTFSFWGAYLNKNTNKVVIGPQKPFTGLKYPFTCSGWIRI